MAILPAIIPDGIIFFKITLLEISMACHSVFVLLQYLFLFPLAIKHAAKVVYKVGGFDPHGAVVTFMNFFIVS